MKKRILVFFVILLMGILTGCGMSEEEASEYVKASLDASYKGDFDKFVEITDSTPEGAKAMYEANIDHTLEAAGFSEMELSEELVGKYRQLFLDISKMVNYKVGDAAENEDGEYDVEVKVYPLSTFSSIKQKEINNVVLKQIEKMDKYPSEKKIIEITFEEIYKVLRNNMQNPVYEKEAVVHTITVHKNEKGMYYISEEDMLELDKTLFDLNN